MDTIINNKIIISPPMYTSKSNVSRFNQLNEKISRLYIKHDSNGCYQCDKMAGYYLQELKYIRRSQDKINCNQELYDFILSITNLILSHRETNTCQNLPWFHSITTELWSFAKQLKEESYESDLYISTQPIHDDDAIYQSDTTTSSNESLTDYENYYRRAIRIVIYNCRALVYEQLNDIKKAIVYYRKCASVKSTPFDLQQNLQHSALNSMYQLINKSSDIASSASTTSSASSTVAESKKSITCGHCGIEKASMPVCSRCKIQTYCTLSCLKSHQPIHTLSCPKK